MTAVVLLSGGMDSCLTCAYALDAGFDVAALHVNYGQRTQDRELASFHAICDHFHITQRLVVDISHLAAIGGSSLTDATIDVSSHSSLLTSHSSLDSSLLTPHSSLNSSLLTSHSSLNSSLPSSYVPFRNANILAIATSWAEVLKAHAIYIGAVEEDSSGYPDCRDSFFDAFERVIEEGTGPDTHIKIIRPVIHHSKKQIVEESMRLAAPLHHSWSCYRNSDRACGTCDSCALRLRGFQQANVEDPIDYAERPRYA